jgi:hypothetical protein
MARLGFGAGDIAHKEAQKRLKGRRLLKFNYAESGVSNGLRGHWSASMTDRELPRL